MPASAEGLIPTPLGWRPAPCCRENGFPGLSWSAAVRIPVRCHCARAGCLAGAAAHSRAAGQYPPPPPAYGYAPLPYAPRFQPRPLLRQPPLARGPMPIGAGDTVSSRRRRRSKRCHRRPHWRQGSRTISSWSSAAQTCWHRPAGRGAALNVEDQAAVEQPRGCALAIF